MKIIGITSHIIKDKRELATVPAHYVEAVRVAGGVPIIIPMNGSVKEIQAILKLVDGVILTGGVDIHPAHYNEPQLQGLGDVDVQRDKSDFLILEQVFAAKISLLGICRGLQALNVYCGGTLIQDIPKYYETNIAHSQMGEMNTTAHDVIVTAGTKTAELFVGKKQFAVNSFHHQAIKDLGAGLMVTIKSEDGIIEGIELISDEHFVVGVQFHPEMFVNTLEYKNITDLFSNFLANC